MKKILCKTLTFIFLLTILLTNLTITSPFALPNLYCEGIYLLDATTGKVLFEKNADVQYMPASTTKVMTAILALENCKLDEKVTIGEKPPMADGSSIGIEAGEVYTIEELLLGLMLESGNDCAEAIAEHISGSNEEFAKLMTARAIELGATNTTFKNPSGLTQEGHLTTAHDLALIMKHAAENKDFVRICQTPHHFYKNHPFSNGTEKWATNKNPLLKADSKYKYDYAYCGKTGYTIAANHSYTAVAKKGDQTIVDAFLNATDKDGFYTSIGQLFDWGFQNYTTQKVISKGDKLDDYSIDKSTSIPLLSTKDIYYTFNIGNGESSTNPDISVKYADKDLTEASIATGDILFDSTVLINGKEVSKLELASGADREYTTKVKINNAINKLISSGYITPAIIAIIIIIIIILIIILRAIYRYKRKRRRFLSRRSYIRRKHNF